MNCEVNVPFGEQPPTCRHSRLSGAGPTEMITSSHTSRYAGTSSGLISKCDHKTRPEAYQGNSMRSNADRHLVFRQTFSGWSPDKSRLSQPDRNSSSGTPKDWGSNYQRHSRFWRSAIRTQESTTVALDGEASSLQPFAILRDPLLSKSPPH